MRIHMKPGFAVVIVAVASVLLSGTLPAEASGSNNPDHFHYNYNVTGVSALSRSNAWAVGSYSAAGKSHAFSLHWNGKTWTRVPVPDIFDASLNAVSAVSGSDVWAVGMASRRNSLVLHWNGAAWARVPSPSPGQLVTTIYAVTGISATDAWAVGTADNTGGSQVLLLHWDGKSWTQALPASLGSVSFLSGVAAVSASDVWAVGEYYPTSSSQSEVTLVLHWNGKSWRTVPSPNPRQSDGTLPLSVSAASATDVWAVGQYAQRRHNGIQGSLAMHWNGKSWRIVPSPNPRGSVGTQLDSVSAVSATDVWAVGHYSSGNCCAVTRALVLHWNGKRWSQVPIPNPGPRRHHNNSLDAVSAVSARNAWAVGSYYNYAVQNPLILHWNGKAWIVS